LERSYLHKEIASKDTEISSPQISKIPKIIVLKNSRSILKNFANLIIENSVETQHLDNLKNADRSAFQDSCPLIRRCINQDQDPAGELKQLRK
jgi:hypothetical protein